MGIISGLGAYSGSKREAKGYRRAKETLELLKPEIKKAHSWMDPWSQYRGGYADQLHNILQAPSQTQGQADWTTDPGYQFRVAEDTRATERAASAKNSNISGNVLAELGSRRQEMASQEYGNVINRLIGLSAATPENAIAGGQFYGQSMSQIALGQAEAEIGRGFAQSRGKAALYTGAEDTLYSLLNYFVPGGNFGANDKGTGGGMPWGQQQGGLSGGSISNSQGQVGGMGTNLTGWGQQGMGGWENTAMGQSGGLSQIGGGMSSFSGSTSSVGSIW